VSFIELLAQRRLGRKWQRGKPGTAADSGNEARDLRLVVERDEQRIFAHHVNLL
jgi:hypothetical protein